MAERLRFHPLVPEDLRQAINWFDDISSELGNRFREMVDSGFDDIEASPAVFGQAFDDIRFARVHRFPYLILFREVGQSILILGVFHTASDPEKWRQRLQGAT